MTPLLQRTLLLLFALLTSACRAETHAFHWVTGSVGGLPERQLAMLVPVTIGSRTCDMQIDTGANGSVIWKQSSSADEPTESVTVKLGSLEEVASASPAVRRAIEGCSDAEPVGTLGNAFFDRGTLTIDSAHSQLTYEPGSKLGGRKNAQRFFYATWASGGGHILIELSVKGFGKGYGMLDTGAALAELGVLDERWWARLVGSSSLSGDGVTRFTVNSWGKQIECFHTQARAEVALDTFPLAARNVTYCPALPFRPPIQVVGLVGMQLFQHRILSIDYPARLWSVEDSH